ncbi:sigma-70 family RNA polymerase sigma factor [Pseudonocardia sp. RS11V-5]|uniref:RNA polymerase sigma factor n=1 Tax=Pseudonocardia terrae TaxID=2905831 RepID=UPI001E5170E4|nr:sigma-70 family RNA polymerase sigma factor [Pseudonocardia terrae]MCE3551784.1 sigma-70 family RNA polymerase sigma factor [Pseudonocardia terrae]
MPIADPELVQRLREGDEQAFAEVVRAWSPAMLRVARAHVRTHATAEEVVQEAWLAVLRGLDGFAARASLRTWVFTILVNAARRRGRAEARHVVELGRPSVAPERFRGEDDEYPGHWRDEAAPVEWGPESEVLAAEFRGLLERALAELPDRQRAVVELRDVHGFAAEEVCALLDLTPANQRVLLHRARSRLRGLLEAVIA